MRGVVGLLLLLTGCAQGPERADPPANTSAGMSANNGGAWILWLRQISIQDGKGGTGIWEPTEGFASVVECNRKASDMLTELSKGEYATRQPPNGMLFGAIPIGDNTVTLMFPSRAGEPSKKSEGQVISIACFPPTFDPRSNNRPSGGG